VVAGDIIIGDAVPRWARKSKGTDGQFLKLTGGLPTWADPPAGADHNVLSTTHPDTLPASVVRGDLLLGNSTPKWARGGIGSANALLKTDGFDPLWGLLVNANVDAAAAIAEAKLALNYATHARLHALSDALDHSGEITDVQHGSRGSGLHGDSHARSHALDSALDHTGAINDAGHGSRGSGLHADSHARSHALDSALDHTGTITDTQHGSRGSGLHADSHTRLHALNSALDHSGELPLTDLAAGSQGDMIRRGATDWEALAKGATGRYLKAGATDIAWTARTFTVGGSILSPTAAINVIALRAPFACTAVEVNARQKGGASSVVNARKNGTLNLMSANLTLTSADTWYSAACDQNQAFALDDWLEIMVVTVGGATEVFIQVEFTEP